MPAQPIPHCSHVPCGPPEETLKAGESCVCRPLGLSHRYQEHTLDAWEVIRYFFYEKMESQKKIAVDGCHWVQKKPKSDICQNCEGAKPSILQRKFVPGRMKPIEKSTGKSQFDAGEGERKKSCLATSQFPWGLGILPISAFRDIPFQ